MKRIALLLMVGLCVGCGPATGLKFQKEQVVNLKIGGRGQIISVPWYWHTSPYKVRINTDEGPRYRQFREFELEVQP
jgi:hypothetical protein